MKTNEEIKALTLTPEDTKRMRLGVTGIHFQSLRKIAGMTLEEVSKELTKSGDPLSVAMISLFERGKRELQPEFLEHLEQIYGIADKDRKASALQRTLDHIPEALRKILFASLSTQTPTEEPRDKTAKGRKLTQLRREVSALQLELENAKLRILGLERMNTLLQQTNQELQRLVDKARHIKAFYGEQ
jgi:transcriptional regulator with XRE-family HTH domain